MDHEIIFCDQENKPSELISKPKENLSENSGSSNISSVFLMNVSCVDHKDIPNNSKDNNEIEYLEINKTIDKVMPAKK